MPATTNSLDGAGPSAGAEDRVMATAQQILKSINAPKDVQEDMMLIFSNFDNRLSKITDLVTTKSVDEKFESAEQVILRWESSSASLPWVDSPNEAADYLSALDEILLLCKSLSVEDDKKLVERADTAIQLAMARLEVEFRQLLIQNTVPLDADRLYGSIHRVSLSFTAHDVEIGEEFESFGEGGSGSGSGYHDRGASLSGDLSVDLINPDVVVELREIAERMVQSGYEKECCQVYSSVRRETLDECLAVLGVEKLSIEEVQKIEWKDLDEKMKRWVQAVKITIRVLLPCEKELGDLIFFSSDDVWETCFNETVRWPIMQILTFGEAVSIAERSSEKLFRLLDMYDALKDAIPDLERMMNDEIVVQEAGSVLGNLGEAVKGTFTDFENAVKRESSKKPMPNGEIHPLTRYVMNYLKLLVVYSGTLNSLLVGENDLDGDVDDDENGGGHEDVDSEPLTPLARHLLSLLSSLESNLEEKSKLYEDDGTLQYIFLMNNKLYIVQKVKDSELLTQLGDHWVRKHRGQVRQYATGYLRSSWTKALSFLKDEGLGGGSMNNAAKNILKDRFKKFNACFEEIYRVQTAWKVPDPQLRDELKISISERLIPAYRSFEGRFRGQLEGGRNSSGRYIKYMPEDLENYLSDLFEGSPSLLTHHPLRRSSQ